MVDQNYTERRSDGLGCGEEGADFLGRGIGGDVPIRGLEAQERVADAAPGEVGDVAAVAQPFKNGQGVGARAEGFHWTGILSEIVGIFDNMGVGSPGRSHMPR